MPKQAGDYTLGHGWLHLTESGVILNRFEIHKFVSKVAELIATLRR